VPRPTRKGKDEIADISEKIQRIHGEWMLQDIDARQRQSGHRWCNFAGKCGSYISKLITALNKDKKTSGCWFKRLHRCIKIVEPKEKSKRVEPEEKSNLEIPFETRYNQFCQKVIDSGLEKYAQQLPEFCERDTKKEPVRLWRYAKELVQRYYTPLWSFAYTIVYEQTLCKQTQVRQKELDKENSAKLVADYILMFIIFGGAYGVLPLASDWGDRFDWDLEVCPDFKKMDFKKFECTRQGKINYFVKIEDLKPIDPSSKRSHLEQHVCELLDIVVRDHCKALCNSSLDPAKGEPLQQVEKS
jgi:hypothetical protein